MSDSGLKYRCDNAVVMKRCEFEDEENKGQMIYGLTLGWLGGSKFFKLDKEQLGRIPKDCTSMKIAGTIQIDGKGKASMTLEQFAPNDGTPVAGAPSAKAA